MLGAHLIPLATLGTTVGAVIGMIVLFGVAVAVHELGHLMWAKAFGVGAEEFAIGFGKRLWSRKWGGTIYSIRMLPLGGFVKIKGMVGALEEAEQREGEGEREDKPEQRSSLVKDAVYESALAMKDLALWKKILVFSGGVINNVILAWIILFLMAMLIGFPPQADMPALVGWIDEDSPAAAAGLRRGDEIIAVNGRNVSAEAQAEEVGNLRWSMMASMILEGEGASATLTVQRDGALEEILWSEPPIEVEDFDAMLSGPIPAHIAAITPHGAAERAGLAANDTIVEIDGYPIAHWRDLQVPLTAADGATIEISFDRGGVLMTTRLRGEHKDYIDEETGGRWTIGFFPGLPEPEGEWECLGPWDSASYGALKIADVVGQMFAFLWKMASFQASGQEIKDNLGGPVMIFNFAYRSAEAGLVQFLWFAAVLNVILAVMNILPYPILDGGHIVFNVIESIRGKSLSLRTLERVYGGAFALLLVFMAWLVLKDVFTIFG